MTLRRLLSRPFLLALPLLAFGAWQVGGGTYIHAKAQLAQVLLERSWAQTLDGTTGARPWPWADTWPVARLVVPGHQVDQVVLAGASGSSLAFAPGHVDGTARPGGPGNCVIAAHRDTHFRFLSDVKIGDEIELQAGDDGTRRYAVRDIRIVDHRQAGIELATTKPHLTLVTCYPFDALAPGGPLRYVVIAEQVA